MAANKRQPGEIQHDRKTIAHLYVRGLTHQEITAELNREKPAEIQITRQMVTREIKALVREWQTSVVTDIGQVLAVQLRRLAWIEAEAEDAWERSKLDAQERHSSGTQEGAPVLDKQGKVQFDKTGLVVREQSRSGFAVKQKGQVGGAQYLAVMLECVRERNRIFGLYAPEKLKVDELDAAIEAALRAMKGEQVTTSEMTN
jgi:hypothetical protein